MGSLYQEAAWDCYPGVCGQGQGHLLKIEIQFPLNNFSLLWPFNTKFGVWVAYIKRQAWDCYPGVCDQGKGQPLLKVEIKFPFNN